MSPPPVTRNPAKTLQQQQPAQQKGAQDTTPQKTKEPFHFDEDIGLGCVQGWFGQQGAQAMKPISDTPQKGTDWVAEKRYEHLENRHQSELKRHVLDLKEALGDIDGGSVLINLRDLFQSDADALSGSAICDPPQQASAWTCQTWDEARRLPFDDGNLDATNDNENDEIEGDDTVQQQQQEQGMQKATGLATIFGGLEGATDAHAICDPPQDVKAWHAEKDSMRLPFNGEGDLKLEGHHDLKCDDAAGGTDTQQRSIGKQQVNVVTPSDLGKVFGGLEGTTDAHAICDPPQPAGAWHAEKDSMRLPFNGEGNQKIEGEAVELQGDDIGGETQQQQEQGMQKATGLATIFGGLEGATDAHAICDPPQDVKAWHAEKDSMRLPFNGEGDLKLEGHHDLKCDDAAGGADTQQRGIGKQQVNVVVTPSDLGKVFGGLEGTTEAHAICDPPQPAGAWHAEKDSMRLPFNGEGNQKIEAQEAQEEGGDIEAGANADTNIKSKPQQQQQRFVEPVTPCDLGQVFGGVEGFTENHAICDPPQKASEWIAEVDSMRPPFQTQAKHEQNVFMRRQQHAHQG